MSCCHDGSAYLLLLHIKSCHLVIEMIDIDVCNVSQINISFRNRHVTFLLTRLRKYNIVNKAIILFLRGTSWSTTMINAVTEVSYHTMSINNYQNIRLYNSGRPPCIFTTIDDFFLVKSLR